MPVRSSVAVSLWHPLTSDECVFSSRARVYVTGGQAFGGKTSIFACRYHFSSRADRVYGFCSDFLDTGLLPLCGEGCLPGFARPTGHAGNGRDRDDDYTCLQSVLICCWVGYSFKTSHFPYVWPIRVVRVFGEPRRSPEALSQTVV